MRSLATLFRPEPKQITPAKGAPQAGLWGADIDQPNEEVQIARARNPEELVEFFSTEIWRFVSSQVQHREDAEDVVMEVFAAAFKDFPRLERADNQRHWLLGIARRKVADAYRKRYRRAEMPLSEGVLAPTEGPSPMQLATRGALAQLPDNQREVLVLKYVNGLSTEETGRVTKRSATATNSLLQRGRQSLREALGGTFGEFATNPQIGEER